MDSIAEGVDTVGVEWHVQCGATAFPLGRGLSQARVCTQTGKIERVVDIAEAPWRVIGLIALPFINVVQALMALLMPPARGERLTRGRSPTELAGAAGAVGEGVRVAARETAPSQRHENEKTYGLMLGAVLVDGVVDPAERDMLASFAAENGVSPALHVALLEEAGWSEEDYRQGSRSR